MVVIDETYEDGSEYFEWDDGSFEYYSADGNLINSYYAPSHPSDSHSSGSPGWAQGISQILSSVFGTQPQQPQYRTAARTGVNVSPQTGLQISPMMLAIGGLVVGAFVFGRKGK